MGLKECATAALLLRPSSQTALENTPRIIIVQLPRKDREAISFEQDVVPKFIHYFKHIHFVPTAGQSTPDRGRNLFCVLVQKKFISFL